MICCVILEHLIYLFAIQRRKNNLALFFLVDIICASFTSTPPNPYVFTPPNSLLLQWTFNSQTTRPVVITFEKYHPASNAYDSLVDVVVPISLTTVYIDQDRIDVCDQSCLRINDSMVSDAGRIRIKVLTESGTYIFSEVQIVIAGWFNKICQALC